MAATASGSVDLPSGRGESVTERRNRPSWWCVCGDWKSSVTVTFPFAGIGAQAKVATSGFVTFGKIPHPGELARTLLIGKPSCENDAVVSVKATGAPSTFIDRPVMTLLPFGDRPS